MKELFVVTYDPDLVRPEQINSVAEQLDGYGVWYVVAAKGITVEFVKPVDQDADGITE